ncbi:MAG TPA: AprI/Inh family metalloprotease inhibitor [Pseudolabrys sp.]|nr:AprI/Inh family metalloprotease inhibitor [Pseudolabrys sp.]
MTRCRIAAAALALLVLAGCAGEQASLFGNRAPAAPPTPKITMAGRWMLAEPGIRPCGLRFGGAAGATQGTIAPEGGCPGDFFTSRHWALENGNLVIKDHRDEPLANLVFADGQFRGTSVTGAPVTLSR